MSCAAFWKPRPAYDASVLDDKVAESVFIQLSGIFGQKEGFSARVVENSTKCLRLIIQHGWKTKITKELSQQLLILLSFIVGGVPGQEEKADRPEETILEGYRALAALIRVAGPTRKSTSPLVETSVIPVLAHSVTVVLDGVTDGSTAEIQLEALGALGALYTTLGQPEPLASFLPGVVSSLTRLLSPPPALKQQKRVLVKGLQVLKDVLAHVLGDMATRAIQYRAKGSSAEKDDAGSGKILTPAWLSASASQVKTALSTVLKLRNHESQDVLRAVERLCIGLLDECNSSWRTALPCWSKAP